MAQPPSARFTSKLIAQLVNDFHKLGDLDINALTVIQSGTFSRGQINRFVKILKAMASQEKIVLDRKKKKTTRNLSERQKITVIIANLEHDVAIYQQRFNTGTLTQYHADMSIISQDLTERTFEEIGQLIKNAFDMVRAGTYLTKMGYYQLGRIFQTLLTTFNHQWEQLVQFMLANGYCPETFRVFHRFYTFCTTFPVFLYCDSVTFEQWNCHHDKLVKRINENEKLSTDMRRMSTTSSTVAVVCDQPVQPMQPSGNDYDPIDTHNHFIVHMQAQQHTRVFNQVVPERLTPEELFNPNLTVAYPTTLDPDDGAFQFPEDDEEEPDYEVTNLHYQPQDADYDLQNILHNLPPEENDGDLSDISFESTASEISNALQNSNMQSPVGSQQSPVIEPFQPPGSPTTPSTTGSITGDFTTMSFQGSPPPEEDQQFNEEVPIDQQQSPFVAYDLVPSTAPVPKPRRRGRPLGSKNKPKTSN